MKGIAAFAVLLAALVAILTAGMFMYNYMGGNVDAPSALRPVGAATEAAAEARTEAQTETQTETQTEAKTVAQTVTQVEKQTDAQTVAQTESQTVTQAETQTESQTVTQAETQTETQAGEQGGGDGAQADERVSAPDFTVYDASGGAVKLSDMLGKPVVLNFWASWCPPCKSEMPDFDNVYKELGETVHFMMVDAVDGSRETMATGEKYIAEQGHTFPVYYDSDQDAQIKYGIRALPTSLFIDAEGYIVTGAEGAISEELLRTGIEYAVAGALR